MNPTIQVFKIEPKINGFNSNNMLYNKRMMFPNDE